MQLKFFATDNWTKTFYKRKHFWDCTGKPSKLTADNGANGIIILSNANGAPCKASSIYVENNVHLVVGINCQTCGDFTP